MAHTPGPWNLRGDSRRYEIVGETPTGDTDPLAVCENAGTSNEANARLIAAAPDMLEALKKLRDLRHQWRHDDQFTSIDYMDAIDALPWESAIAKAEGK